MSIQKQQDGAMSFFLTHPADLEMLNEVPFRHLSVILKNIHSTVQEPGVFCKSDQFLKNLKKKTLYLLVAIDLFAELISVMLCPSNGFCFHLVLQVILEVRFSDSNAVFMKHI